MWRLVRLLSTIGDIYEYHTGYKGWQLRSIFPTWQDSTDILLMMIEEDSFIGEFPGEHDPDLCVVRPKSPTELCRYFHRYLSSLYTHMLEAADKSTFVDDNTWSIMYAKEFHEILPDSHMIHMVRHPLDVIASMMKQTWCPSDPILCARWYDNIMQAINTATARDKEYLEVRYEDLVFDTKTELASICGYTGLNYLDTSDFDIYTTSINRWRRELPEDKLDQIIEITQPHVDNLEYGV